MSDTKKEVCRTLTNVVRRSPLAGQIDPKSFFVMLNNNFSMLYRNSTLDLAPVWDALTDSNPAPPIYGLFLAFEDAAAERGFQVALPAAVGGLDGAQRQAYAELLAAGHQPDLPDIVELTDDAFFATDPSATAIPLSLGSQDLKPFIPDDFKREIVQVVVQCLKIAPVGAKLDSGQLAYLVDSNFEDLCDGRSFDFAPILGGLRQLDGVTDSDVYVGVVHLERALAERNLVLEPLQMDVDAELAERLMQEAERLARQRAEEAAREARTKTLDTPAPAAPPKPILEVPRGANATEQRLSRWGLTMLSSRRMRILRQLMLAAALVVVTVTGWLTRPDRGLDVDGFAASVPMKTAELRDGVFYGQVDDSKWWSLEPAVRKQRVKALEAYMASQGWIPNSQIRDSKGRLVMIGKGGRDLAATKFFVVGSADGTVPESERVASPDAPPEAIDAANKKKPKAP